MPRRRAAKSGRDDVELPDGARMAVRPIDPADKGVLVGMFERLSERSRYRRFLSPKTRLTDRELAAFTELDHHDEEALIGLAGNGEAHGVGVARYVRSPVDSQVAEVAVAVADDWQGRGVGGVLLERLADRAREEGIRRFNALILSENREVRSVFERIGDVELHPAGQGQTNLDIELPQRGGVGPALARALKAAALKEIRLGEAGNVFRRGPAAVRARLEALRPEAEVRRGGPIRTVVAATDGSDRAGHAVRAAGELAERLGARVVLVGVRNPNGVYPPADVADSDLGRDGLEVSVRTPVGEPSSAILDAASEEGADLIVLGDRGMSGPGRFLLGSVTDRVSHHAPCSVLIVRE